MRLARRGRTVKAESFAGNPFIAGDQAAARLTFIPSPAEWREFSCFMTLLIFAKYPLND